MVSNLLHTSELVNHFLSFGHLILHTLSAATTWAFLASRTTLICLPCLHTPANGAFLSGYPAGFAVPIRSPSAHPCITLRRVAPSFAPPPELITVLLGAGYSVVPNAICYRAIGSNLVSDSQTFFTQ